MIDLSSIPWYKWVVIVFMAGAVPMMLGMMLHNSLARWPRLLLESCEFRIENEIDQYGAIGSTAPMFLRSSLPVQRLRLEFIVPDSKPEEVHRWLEREFGMYEWRGRR